MRCHYRYAFTIASILTCEYLILPEHGAKSNLVLYFIGWNSASRSTETGTLNHPRQVHPDSTDKYEPSDSFEDAAFNRKIDGKLHLIS